MSESTASRSLSGPQDSSAASKYLRTLAEFIVLALIVISPWPYGGVEAGWQFAFYVTIGVLLGIWCLHALVVGSIHIRLDFVSVCLLGIILVTGCQLAPLPMNWIRTVSPTEAKLLAQLRPQESELLPGERPEDIHRTNRMPLSLDPPATAEFLSQLVGIFLIYMVVRNLVASKAAFLRLAWVCLGNGVILAVLAVANYFSKGQVMASWWERFGSTGFGPFVNRNHYPFYLSLCGGMGLGLLLMASRQREKGQYRLDTTGFSLRERLFLVFSEAGLTRSPKAIGILGCIALIAASIPLSLSRGGILAMAMASIVTAVVGWSVGSQRRRRQWVVSALIVAAVLGFSTWFGWEPVFKRMGSLRDRAQADDRTEIWGEAWKLVCRYPLTGVGGGAFPRAETVFRDETSLPPEMIVNSVHNEFLEALTEGGVLRLVLTLGLIAATAGISIVGYRRFRRRTLGPLLLGAAYGFMAVAFHSFFDFGIHIPAVAILTIVIAGQVSAITREFRDSEERREKSPRDGNKDRNEQALPVKAKSSPWNLTFRGLALYCVGAFLILIGVQLAWSGWRVILVNRLRLAAARLLETDGADRWTRSAEYLEKAIRAHPGDGELWNELAATHLSALTEHSGFEPVLAGVGGIAAANPPEHPLGIDIKSHVLPALRAARRARDLSPLLPGPHLRLGEFAEFLARTEPAETHFTRAQFVGRYDPDVWYLSGVEAYKNGQHDKAWKDWRESLSRSPRRLTRIVQMANRTLSAEQIREKVLPDDPALWVQSTALLFPVDDPDPERQAAWLRAAMARWAELGGPGQPADWILWARTHERLREWPLALKVWREAVKRNPESELVHDGFAQRLEADELYGEAIEQLEWLVRFSPHSSVFRDRLEAARHGLELEKELAKP